MSVSIRRTADRFVDREQGRVTHHTFSFGAAYDPEWLSFGPMVCHDDHLLGSGRGFDEHPHASLEILTWVVAGSVRHTDSSGVATEVAASGCGRLSAGSGVRHSEFATDAGPARFVQVWLTPDDPSAAPSYDSVGVTAGPGDGLVPVAGEGGPLSIGVAGAAYAVARLAAGETLTLPAAPRVHAYVTTGALRRFSLASPIQAGDSVLMTDEPEHTVTANVPTEVLVWTFG